MDSAPLPLPPDAPSPGQIFYLIGLILTLLLCGFWVKFTYRRAVSHLRRLQRDTALRIAREELARFGPRGEIW